ncbi:hypothetical protein GCM10009106_08370 [Sphingomonas japonica]
MTQPERVMIDEARMITGLPERTLQSMSARGEIWGAAKLGRRWTFDRQRLRAWVRAKEAASGSRQTSIRGTVSFTLASPSTAASSVSHLKRLVAEKLSAA